jgi:hypothetical protein
MQIHTSNINSSRFPYTPYGYCENEFRQWHYTNRWKKSLTHAWKQRKHHTKLSNCCTNTIQGGLEHLSGKVWLAVQPNLIVPREEKALQEDRGVPHVILATKHDKRHDWQNDLQSWTEKLKKKNLKKKTQIQGKHTIRSESNKKQVVNFSWKSMEMHYCIKAKHLQAGSSQVSECYNVRHP